MYRISLYAPVIFLASVTALTLFSCQSKNNTAAITVPYFEDASLPKVFEENRICTGDYETHAAFSPSGDTVYFLKCMPDLATCAICVSYKKDSGWTEPAIASFSGKYLDVDPFVTKDGNTIYFVSNRPYKEGDTVNPSWDIWKTERNNKGWNDPLHLDSIINSDKDEYYPSVTDDGTLYFGSSRDGGKGGSDIYRCKQVNGVYTRIENLGDSINTSDNEYEAFIAQDESYLLFMATIPKGLNNADFYYSKNSNGAWSKAQKINGPVNSSATEWSPKVTRDGKYFYFGSTRNRLTNIPAQPETLKEFTGRINQSGNGSGDIYYVNFSSLKLENKK